MKDIQHYKKLLEGEKNKLESELATVGRKNPDQKEDWEAVEPETNLDRADEDEVAVGILEYEDNKGILDQLEKRLNEVKISLEKIENGTYGLCSVCGKKIEEDRLDANPAANTCKAHM
jgi:RNA polymerase-binding transcription factor DksA